MKNDYLRWLLASIYTLEISGGFWTSSNNSSYIYI